MPKKVPENAEPRFPISFRAPAELKAKLEAAAAAASRSVGQELVRRLERAFTRDEVMQHVDGLLSDSLIKGEEVDNLRAELERATARNAELEALLRAALALRRPAYSPSLGRGVARNRKRRVSS